MVAPKIPPQSPPLGVYCIGCIYLRRASCRMKAIVAKEQTARDFTHIKEQYIKNKRAMTSKKATILAKDAETRAKTKLVTFHPLPLPSLSPPSPLPLPSLSPPSPLPLPYFPSSLPLPLPLLSLSHKTNVVIVMVCLRAFKANLYWAKFFRFCADERESAWRTSLACQIESRISRCRTKIQIF